jgi:hypothetical protein
MNRRRRPSRGWMKVKNERNGRKMDERYTHKSNVQMDEQKENNQPRMGERDGR